MASRRPKSEEIISNLRQVGGVDGARYVPSRCDQSDRNC